MVILLIASEKIRVYPTQEQEEMFWKFSGVARFAYNECLGYKIEVYDTEGYSCTVQDLIKHLQDLKYTDEYCWLREVPESVTKQSIKDLDKAYKLFFKRGNKGFPKFKKKNKCIPSFYQRTDNFRIIDSNHIKLTGIKEPVRIKQSIRVNHVLNPRVSFDGKFWYFSYSYELDCFEKSKSDKVVGVDLGIKNLAITSDNTTYKNINKSSMVKKLEHRKKHLQRKLSNKYEMNKNGSNFVKTSNIIKLERQIRMLDRKLKNIRDTYIHQVTYDLVKTKPGCIVIEDLNVSGMMKNKHLSKAIQQQCFYKFRQYLTYKCEFYGVDLIIADRFFASSKTCSCCGYKRKFLSLSERTFICPDCGNIIDRDLNAAVNLRNYAYSV